MKKVNMSIQIVSAVILGVIVGLVLGEQGDWLKIFGDLFLRLIQMSIVLLVMGQIIEAVGSLNPKNLGKMGLKTIVIFLGSSLLAATFGILMGVFFNPGSGVDAELISGNIKIEQAAMGSISETILAFFPVNVVEAMAQGSIVQVIFFALLFGISLSYLAQEGVQQVVLPFIKEFNQIILKMVTLIMQIAPIGIFALIASTIGKMGLSVVRPLVKYLLVYGFATFLFLILWIVVITIYCRINPFKLVQNIWPMSIMALATISSAVTLPTALNDSQEKLGIKERVAKLVVPLGMSLNSNGSAMHMAITVVTIAQIYGFHYSVAEYANLAVLATLASLANAVVPGAGLVSLTMVVPQMGLPLESIALFAGVEWFVGMLRTILNVDSDVFSAMLVAQSENELDLTIFNG